MTSARPYRFPAPPEEDEPTRRSAGRSCGTCGASAVASCVALCCCPCAVVSCFTLALVKAPYAAGRRCVARLAKRRQIRGVLRKTKRVRSLDDQQYQEEEELGGGAARVSKEWGELGRAGAGAGASGGNANDASVVGEGCRMRVSATEKLWAEMYQVGHWGFGRLSFSAAATQVITEGSEKDGNADVGQ